jgi:hypothetical protein
MNVIKVVKSAVILLTISLVGCNNMAEQETCQQYNAICQKLDNESTVDIIVTLKGDDEDKLNFIKLLESYDSSTEVEILKVFKHSPQILVKVNKKSFIFIAKQEKLASLQLDHFNTLK